MKYIKQSLLRILGALVLVAATSSVASTMAQNTIILVSGGGSGFNQNRPMNRSHTDDITQRNLCNLWY